MERIICARKARKMSSETLISPYINLISSVRHMSNELSRLLSSQESETLDFKEMFSLRSKSEKAEFAKDVSAFANTRGGHVIYGVSDRTRNRIGIDRETFDEDKMEQVVSSRVNPPPEFSAKIVCYDGTFFGLIIIPESLLKPHQIVQTGQIFIRRGATTDRARTEEIRSMFREKESLGGVPTEPESDVEAVLISFWRKYTIWRYRRLDVSLKKEKIAIAIIGSILLIPLFYLLYRIPATRSVPNGLYLSLSIVFFGCGFFLLYMLSFIEGRKCPKCNKLFGVRRVDTRKISEKEVYRTNSQIEFDVVYLDTCQCDFCGYKDTKDRSVKRIVPINS